MSEEKTRKEEIEQALKETAAEIKRKRTEANEAIREGKGVLTLETPIMSGDEEVTELTYDFTNMTGMEYANAMDSDSTAQQVFRITYKQALSLFATSAAKNSSRLDQRDIMERIGMTDAVEAVQLATLFFSASTRAGQMRISKK